METIYIGSRELSGKRKDTESNRERVKKSYDRILLYVYKGGKTVIKEYAEEHGETVNGLINRLLAKEIDGFDPTDTSKMKGW